MSKIFLTGATGFLGGELAVALSKIDSVEKIYCLIRSKCDEDARVRLKDIFALHGDYYDPDKVQAVRGDLRDAELSAHLTGARMLADVDVVIHSAANTSFLSQKYPAVAETNINGTERLLSWATHLRHLKAFAYVGTASIVGAGPSVTGRTIHEDESPNPSASHLVGYTRSKMCAEMAVRAAIPAEKLIVFRPSILVGDSRCLIPRSFDIAWIIVAIRHLQMFFGNPDAACDVISVDYATKAIVTLLMNQDSRRYTTYHVSAGPAATTSREVFEGIDYIPSDLKYCPKEHLALIKKWLRNGGSLCPSLRQYSRQLDHIRFDIGSKNARILLAGLEPYWRFIDLDQRFDNTRILEDAGIGLPEPAHVYLKRTAAFLNDIDPLKAAVNP
jgi:thioester reductase-like protein